MGKWKKGLPKHEKEVLIWPRVEGLLTGVRRGDKMYYVDDDIIYERLCGIKIKYWQELPKTPL